MGFGGKFFFFYNERILEGKEIYYDFKVGIFEFQKSGEYKSKVMFFDYILIIEI